MRSAWSSSERERESVCLFARGVLFSSKRQEEED